MNLGQLIGKTWPAVKIIPMRLEVSAFRPQAEDPGPETRGLQSFG